MRLLIGAALALLVSLSASVSAAQSPRLVKVWELTEGFDRPESALYDAERDVIYVSNIIGEAAAKDGVGTISKVSPSGQMVDADWVSGLNAPKGLALRGNNLYVADIDELVVIDVRNGRVVRRHRAPGAEFLNDVTVSETGDVYVSDSRTAKVHRLRNGRFTEWLVDDDVRAPNGVMVVNGALILAAGGPEAQNAGGARFLRMVNLENQRMDLIRDRTGLGSIDAVEYDERGGFFLSDWGGAKVLHFTPGAGATVLEEISQGTADLDYVPETDMIYLPVMVAGELIAYRVEWR